MNSLERNSLKRIKMELNDLQNNPVMNIGLVVGLPNPNNIYEWRCSMLGPDDTPYSGGLFYLKIIFPKDYPNSKPEICFITPIYHVNVLPYADSLGRVCISTLNWWTPQYTIRKVLIDIWALLYTCNNCCNYRCFEEYQNNRMLYKAKCKYYTNKYARIGAGYKEYKKTDWNFDDPVTI